MRAPCRVGYMVRFSAAGMTSGGYNKRDGRCRFGFDIYIYIYKCIFIFLRTVVGVVARPLVIVDITIVRRPRLLLYKQAYGRTMSFRGHLLFRVFWSSGDTPILFCSGPHCHRSGTTAHE